MRIAAGAALLALAACGGGSDPAPPVATGPRPTSTGSIEIVEPQPGTVAGPDVTVRVKVTGATILERASRDLRPDTGHVHVAMDGETLTLLAGEEFVIEGVEPGRHLIRAEFAAADHGSFSPPVIASVSVTVT